jgi:hypothetical protein
VLERPDGRAEVVRERKRGYGAVRNGRDSQRLDVVEAELEGAELVVLVDLTLALARAVRRESDWRRR